MLNTKNIFVFISAIFAFASAAQAGEVHYQCTAQSAKGTLRVHVALDASTNLLTAVLDDDVRVKGIASETFDRKTETTYYFLQGGSAPMTQRLTLVTRDGGKWARFTKNFGATEFACER